MQEHSSDREDVWDSRKSADSSNSSLGQYHPQTFGEFQGLGRYIGR